MSEEAIIRRKARDHERYLLHREERLVLQKAYYREHRDEILSKKRRKAIEKPCVPMEGRSRAEMYHDWYLRNREAHIARSNERWRKLREANAEAVIRL